MNTNPTPGTLVTIDPYPNVLLDDEEPIVHPGVWKVIKVKERYFSETMQFLNWVLVQNVETEAVCYEYVAHLRQVGK